MNSSKLKIKGLMLTGGQINVCDQFGLLRNAAIRQIYIDQAQSVNTYISRPDSFKDMTLLHLYYFDLGGKTLYYLKQQKETEEEICESCT